MKILNIEAIKEVAGGLETGGHVSISIPYFPMTIPQAIPFFTALGGINTSDELTQISNALIAVGIDPNKVNVCFSYGHEG